ncbi:MAG: PKD domain-containing protein, partial [Bacteroidota bacterium]
MTVQQVPDAQLEPLNAAGWLNCRADINNPNFTLLVENTSTTVSTNQTYIINWGDSTLVNGQMVANIETFDGTFANASHLYQQLLTYEIIVTVIGQNGCSTSQAYTFINGSANPDIGLELDGTSNECIGYMGRFIISNTEDNPPFTRYLIRIDNDDRDSFFFNHPPPDTFEYVFNTGSCFDTTIISSVTYPHSFSVSITAIVDSCGSSTAAVGPIRIDEPPLAAFSIEPDSIQCVRKDTFRLTNESIPGDYNILGTDDCSDSTWYYWTVFPDANYTVTEGTLGLYNDFPSLATQGSTDGISLVFNAPGEYTLSLIAQSYFGSVCDTSMAVKTICVLPDPVANFTASTTLTCGPADITFTNTSNTLGACEAAQYNWSVDFLESECGSDSIFRFVGSNNISPTIRFEGSGQYRVELEVINRCDTSRHEQIITIARSSIVEIDSIQDACLSTVITPSFENLTDCYAPGNCMWFIPNASNPAIIDTFMGCDPPAISYNIVGTYTIGVKVTNDCGESTDTETFTLFDLPDIPDITTNGPVCFGDDFCLTVSNLGPNQIIEWLGPQGWVSTSLSDCLDEVRSADAGRYQLTVTDTITGCSNVGSTTLTVLLLPDLDLNPEEPELCLGDTLPIDIIRRSATVHTWFPDYNISTTSGTSVEVYPTVDTTYIVISTDTITGCRRVDSLFVDVHPLPDVSAGPDTFVCVGQDLQLGGTPAGGIWMDAQGGILSQGIFNENITGLYTLYYDFTDAQGCFGQDSLTVCVLNNPLASFTIDTSAACVGATIQTTNTSNVLNDCLAAEYHWSVSFDGADCHADSSGWSFSSGNANSLQPAFDFQRSGQYTIELEIVHPCNTVRSSRTVVIGEAPTVQIDSLDLLCETLSIRPTASVSLCDGGLQATYSWSFPDATNLNTFNGPNPPVITYPGTGTYTIRLSVTNACGTTTDSYTFEIFDRPVVMPQNSGPICEGDDLQLFANSTA